MTRPALRRRPIASMSVLALALPLLALTAPPTASAAPPSWQADLRVDANRDGRVSAADTPGEDRAGARSGAVFLPNLDDDARRCPRTGPAMGKDTDRRLDGCNDSTNRVVDGALDARDLARIRIPAQARLPKSATGRISTTRGASRTNLFLRRAGRWQIVTPTTRLTRAELTKGATLGIEGKDVAGRGWDGRAVVRLSVTAGRTTRTDSVTLRVAPLLSHHHLQTSQQVLVSAVTDKPFTTFRSRLSRAVARNGVSQGLRRLAEQDPWTQDLFEPMYVSMPSGSGSQAMRILLRSDQNREGNRAAYQLRGPGTGVYWMGAAKRRYDGTLSSMGNFETIPPYRHQGKSYPAGRIILGQRGKEKPSTRITAMLRAQGLQDPLMLDTSFLYVGHVDEFIQFVPARTARGWRVAVADPRAGLDLLRQAKASGQGAARVVQGTPDGGPLTINQALGSTSRSVVPHNTSAARIIDANIARVKAATGVTDAEILRIPTLFDVNRDGEGPESPATTADGGGTQPSRTTGDAASEVQDRAAAGNGRGARAEAPAKGTRGATQRVQETVALLPDAVNSLVLTKGEVLAAKQFGPKVGGRDIFADAVRKAYARGGITVRWIDDFETYHLGQGEVHCGTNSLRVRSGRWWR